MWGTRQPASRDRFAPKLGIDVIDGVLDDTSETVVVLGAQPHGGVRTSQNRPERLDPGVLLLALFLGIHGQSQFLEVNHFAGMPSSDHTGHQVSGRVQAPPAFTNAAKDHRDEELLLSNHVRASLHPIKSGNQVRSARYLFDPPGAGRHPDQVPKLTPTLLAARTSSPSGSTSFGSAIASTMAQSMTSAPRSATIRPCPPRATR